MPNEQDFDTIKEIENVLVNWAKESISRLLSLPELTEKEIKELNLVFISMKLNNFSSIDMEDVATIDKLLNKYKDIVKSIIFEKENYGT